MQKECCFEYYQQFETRRNDMEILCLGEKKIKYVKRITKKASNNDEMNKKNEEKSNEDDNKK